MGTNLYSAKYIYRPQTKFAKVMFLHVSVILFTGMGLVSQHVLQVSRPTPRGKVEGSGLGGLQAHTKGEIEGSGLGGVSRPTPRGGC